VKPRAIIALLAVAAVLAAAFFISRRPRPEPVTEVRHYVWDVGMEELASIRIELPRAGKSGSWVKKPDQYWYFDAPGGPQVDMKRWGGGVPLILSGPGANRRVSADAAAEQLGVYGISRPRMRITLGLEDGRRLAISVGDPTPDGKACYVALAEARDVYTVDATWYDVLERLVLEPPYPAPAGKKKA
jgi:hypothetical protein